MHKAKVLRDAEVSRKKKKKVMMSTNKVALGDGGADAGEAVMKARRDTDEA